MIIQCPTCACPIYEETYEFNKVWKCVGTNCGGRFTSDRWEVWRGELVKRIIKKSNFVSIPGVRPFSG